MDRIELQLHEIWCDTLGVDGVDLDADFFAIGGDSLAAVSVFTAIEEEFGIALPASVMLDGSSIRVLARRLSTMQPALDALVTVHGEGSETPLFTVHDALGGIYFAQHLSRALGPGWPVYAFRPPRGGDFAIADTRFEGLAAHYVELLLSRWAGPVQLFGMSYGGIVAFEMALQLRARGHPVEFLAMGDTPAPAIAGDTIAATNPETLLLGGDPPPSFLRRVRDRLGGQGGDEQLLPRDPRELLALVRWRLSKTERVRRQREWQAREALERIPDYPTAAALMTLLKDYRPAGRYDGPVLVIRTKDDLETWEVAPAEDRGWSEHVDGRVQTALVPCELHHHLAESPYVDQLADIVAVELRNATEQQPNANAGG